MMQPRHDTDITGECGRASEAGRVAGLGYDAGCGQGADSIDCGEQLPDLVVCQPVLYLDLEFPFSGTELDDVFARVPHLKFIRLSVVTTNGDFSFFFSSRRRHTSSDRDWSSDVCSSD